MLTVRRRPRLGLTRLGLTRLGLTRLRLTGVRPTELGRPTVLGPTLLGPTVSGPARLRCAVLRNLVGILRRGGVRSVHDEAAFPDVSTQMMTYVTVLVPSSRRC